MRFLFIFLLLCCLIPVQAQTESEKTATIVNGKLMPGSLDDLDSDNIQSIKIVRDAEVIEARFPGEDYEAIIEIVTKDQHALKTAEIIATEPMPRPRRGELSDSVVVVVDGVEFEGDLNDLDPETIGSINVIKNDSILTERYPTRAINGIIDITTRAAAEAEWDRQAQLPEEEREEVFLAVEKMPIYLCADGTEPTGPNKHQCLIEWLQQNIRYPERAVSLDIEGQVQVQFVVEKDGSISNVAVIKSPHPVLSKAAEKLVQNMGPWSPGIQRGEPVRVQFILPVNYALE